MEYRAAAVATVYDVVCVTALLSSRDSRHEALLLRAPWPTIKQLSFSRSNDMLADVNKLESGQILRTKSVMDNLIRRGIAPNRIERTINDAEVAADLVTNKA